jgi:hypothetical protein
MTEAQLAELLQPDPEFIEETAATTTEYDVPRKELEEEQEMIQDEKAYLALAARQRKEARAAAEQRALEARRARQSSPLRQDSLSPVGSPLPEGRGRLRGGNDASLAAYLRDWMNRYAGDPEGNRAQAEAELRDYFLNEPQDLHNFEVYYEIAEDMEDYDMDDVFDYIPAIIEMAEQPYEDDLYPNEDDMQDIE